MDVKSMTIDSFFLVFQIEIAGNFLLQLGLC